MYDLSTGEAIIAVESDEGCPGCFFSRLLNDGQAGCTSGFACRILDRKDNKNVVFVLVSYKLAKNEHTHLRKWIKKGFEWVCPECGISYPIAFNFCPHCGEHLDRPEGDKK